MPKINKGAYIDTDKIDAASVEDEDNDTANETSSTATFYSVQIATLFKT